MSAFLSRYHRFAAQPDRGVAVAVLPHLQARVDSVLERDIVTDIAALEVSVLCSFLLLDTNGDGQYCA
jgi:hypothetical protein